MRYISVLLLLAAIVLTPHAANAAERGDATAIRDVCRKIDLSKTLGQQFVVVASPLCQEHMGYNRVKPESIRDTEALESLIELKTPRNALLKQVNFDREQMVLFAWRGSSSNKISARVEGRGDEQIVHFYNPMLRNASKTADLAFNVHAFVLPKATKWTFNSPK